MPNRKRLYLAAPLFNAPEKAFNVELKKLLSEKFNVFLPQEDGHLLVNLLRKGHDLQGAIQRVFQADVTAVKRSDYVFAVLDGRTIDEGVAFELGLAFALNIPCVGFQTDVRRLWPAGNNPMIEEACSEIFNNLEDVKRWLKKIKLIIPG